MDVKDAHNYLTEAKFVSNLDSFMVFGGEPMLYPNRAIAIFKKANEFRIPKIEMLTNGVWGKNKENAEKQAIKLKEAGLNDVGISVDAFHLQYVPLEYPRNAALALLKAGVENVTWNVTVVESIDAANEYDKKTSQILKTLESVGIDAHIHKIISVGRAAQNLRRYFQPTSLEGPCQGDPILDNVLTNPESVCIEPSGEVDVCWHLPIGNAKEKPLSRIISEYDWRKNSTIKTLVEEGPMGLLKSAEKHSYRFLKDEYISKCHLCVEIRKTFNAS
jgi:MoaA/NifB/PqqE/SkfB family radical SAM enzyme